MLDIARRRVLRNSAINAMGWAAQVALNLVLVPVVVGRLGVDAFGVYTLVVSLIGYFSMAQGLNHASLKYLSEQIVMEDRKGVQESVGAAIMLSGVLGVIGGATVLGMSEYLATELFRVPVAMQDTAGRAIAIAAAGFLPTTLGLALASVPQAVQRYDITNTIMLAVGVANVVLSLLLVSIGAGLESIVAVAVLGSVANAGALLRQARRLLPGVSFAPRLSAVPLRRMASFGGFSFAASAFGTVVHHIDRLVVAAVLGTTPLAIYAVAQVPLSRLMTLIAKLSEVLVPETSRLAAAARDERLEQLYIKSSRYVFVLSGAALIPVGLLAEPLLRVWVGRDLAVEGGAVMTILAISFLLRSFSSVPTVVNLGLGQPGVNAWFSFSTLLIMAVGVYPAVRGYGIVGIAWLSVLSSLNAPLLVVRTNRQLLGGGAGTYWRMVLARPLLVLGAQAAVLFPFRNAESGMAVVAACVGSVGVVLALSVGLGVVDDADRRVLASPLRSLRALRS